MQSIIQFRIPINDDGTIGNPEILKKWTSPIKDTYVTEKRQKIQKEEVKKELQEEFSKSEKCEEIEL